jgi:oxygen-independent coproporphyrinogen-3 oxidase
MTATDVAASIVAAASSGLASLAVDTADQAAEAADALPLPVSLYVHVPFCLSKCGYCDFYSVAGEPSLHARFVDAALFEAGHWSHYGLLDDVPSLYIGGGTPTALGGELVRLIEGLRETATLRPDVEITVETNPETTDAIGIAALLEAGVNRFSIGVQSFDDDVLTTLGRCHDATRTREALAVLRDACLPFSIDLMCGVAGQSFESWEATLEAAVASGARHVSVYPLTVEDGTPLAAAIERGEVARPDPDVAADMMLAAEVALAAAGIPRYEVANYAQPGHEARHNLVYWTGGAYLGVGPHAASMLPADRFAEVADGEGWPVPWDASAPASRVRFTRETPLPEYLRRPLALPEPLESLTASEAAREDVMLGLRLTAGVPVHAAQAAGVAPALRRLEDTGLVARFTGADGAERWATTQKGWLLGNAVFGAVWSQD